MREEENWNIVPKYSLDFLYLTKIEQCQAIACSSCYASWQFPHNYTKEHIILLAKSYGYSLVHEKVLCQKCREEKTIMKRIEEKSEI